MKKGDLQHILQSEFALCGWRFESIAGLPTAFVEDGGVTPFFQPQIIRQTNSQYRIDGFIGFLYRDFENYWVTSEYGSTSRNAHCLALHIANIGKLRIARHIGDPEQIPAFVKSIVSMLLVMPHNPQAICDVFESNQLAGLSLCAFFISGREIKIASLKEFAKFSKPH